MTLLTVCTPQPPALGEIGRPETEAAEMETEGAEAGKPEFISSLGWEDGLIARTAGSAITNQRRDLRRHAGAGRLAGPSR